jgi:hypothetical protein
MSLLFLCQLLSQIRGLDRGIRVSRGFERVILVSFNVGDDARCGLAKSMVLDEGSCVYVSDID